MDINKGDSANPENRSRLVAKEIRKDVRNDLFAATPPLEAKKVLFSFAVTEAVSYRHMTLPTIYTVWSAVDGDT